MKNEMTLDKTGLTIPGSELAECGMAGKDCDSDVREFDLDAVPAPIRKLLLDSGCCPALLECYLEEGDVVYAAE